jgi:hypothetical protein
MEWINAGAELQNIALVVDLPETGAAGQ